MGELILLAFVFVPVPAFYIIRGLWRNYKFTKAYGELEEYVNKSHVLTGMREGGMDTDRLHAMAMLPKVLGFTGVETDKFLMDQLSQKEEE